MNTIDKMLTEYTVKRSTSIFFNIVDVASLASYIIYMKHNQHFKYADRHRKFLKDFYKPVCMPSIEARLTQTTVFYMKSNRVGTWTQSQTPSASKFLELIQNIQRLLYVIIFVPEERTGRN